MEILRKYGAATTVLFPLIKVGEQDFGTAFTHAGGDVQLSKNEAAFANAGTFAHEGNGIYWLALGSAQMDFARGVVTIIDQGTKAWEDQAIIITTYGAPGTAEHSLNVVADYVIRREFEGACDSADGDTKSGRSMLGAIAKLVNKIAASGGTLTVYEDDDTTSLFTQTVTTSGAADPIVTLDTD